VSEQPRRSRLKTAFKLGLGLLALLALTAGGTYWYLRPGINFLLRVIDTTTPLAQLGDPWTEREVRIAHGGVSLRGRVYQPERDNGRTILLIHGVHWGGIDESRLMPLARKLAGMGYTIVTPEITDLKAYEIALRAVDQIEQAALWTLNLSGLPSRDGRIGIFGISFGGGLSVSAAGRPALRDRLAFVMSFGGHADLDRTMKYLCTGKLPGGGDLPAHIYAVAVLLRQAAHKMVPSEQVPILRKWLDLYLMCKKTEAAAQLKSLPSPTRELATHCYERESDKLGQKLLPHITGHVSNKWLSPVRCPPPTCPVFMLHGSVDNVIPPSESQDLGRHLAQHTASHVLVSPLVVHVEVETESKRQMLELVLFSTRWLRQ